MSHRRLAERYAAAAAFRGRPARFGFASAEASETVSSDPAAFATALV